jgi:hypothetical protein
MQFVATVVNNILWGKLAQENVSFYPKFDLLFNFNEAKLQKIFRENGTKTASHCVRLSVKNALLCAVIISRRTLSLMCLSQTNA